MSQNRPPADRILGLTLMLILVLTGGLLAETNRPHVILVMTDDQGWGQAGYYDHPHLETPHLDAMAANGLRFDRFYAGAPNCSPTRATVLTGRTNDRTGVFNHGWPLRRQERTLPEAMDRAGYVTGHFGKWHLNGLRGPGVPILPHDKRHPGVFGFDYWVSVTNFFDMAPKMARNGEVEQFEGDSSEIIVDEALKFIRRRKGGDKPIFTVIWYGSPHWPFQASEEDKARFSDLSPRAQAYLGEMVAMDRSLGTLRRGLREMGLAENTLVWFCSDNGGYRRFDFADADVGGLRGKKNAVYEGGLRVPAVIEWPAVIDEARVTDYPAATMDIFPTLAEIVGLPDDALLEPVDGLSLAPLLKGEMSRKALADRPKPLGFRHTGRAAWIDNDYKLVTTRLEKKNRRYELYNLAEDPKEQHDLFAKKPTVAERMVKAFEAWNRSVNRSKAGEDYPAGEVKPDDLKPRRWKHVPAYNNLFGS